MNSASMKPFQRKKDGSNSWLSIVNQHSRDDQWKPQLKKSKDCINSKVWKGKASHPLADHVSKHRNSHVSMVQRSNHARYQLPNDLARVIKFFHSIESSCLNFLVAIAEVETGENVKSDFEAMAA